jgi:hypothetical protein
LNSQILLNYLKRNRSTSKDGSEHGPEYADFKIGAPWLYLAESLPHCQESDVLVGLLKYDTLAEVTLLPEYTNKSNIVEKTLQYLEVNHILFSS